MLRRGYRGRIYFTEKQTAEIWDRWGGFFLNCHDVLRALPNRSATLGDAVALPSPNLGLKPAHCPLRQRYLFGKSLLCDQHYKCLLATGP